MSVSTSFTGARGIRYPAPDVARGLMLLLIAVANVPFWLAFFPDAPAGGSLDRGWVLVRSLLVDHRAYPLFSILFGFGLMTMLDRGEERHIDARTAELDARLPGMPEDVRTGWIEGFAREARDRSRRLVRRRGWWMLLFGLVHGLVFAGDIIGAYGLVAVLFAGLLARRAWKTLTALGVAQVLVMTLALLASPGASAAGGSAGSMGDGSIAALLDWYYPILSGLLWATSTLLIAVLAAVVPCVVIGAALARTDLLARPDLHRPLLVAIGLGGLALAAAGGAPQALEAAGFAASAPSWAHALHELSGIPGAIGWLALLALLAGPPAERLGAVRGLLSAIGKRSMTAYIGQTILFVAVFGIAGLLGVRGVGQFAGFLIAVGVWAALAAMCGLLERAGYARGPFERLLRRAVALSEIDRPIPPIPAPPAYPPDTVPAGATERAAAPEDPMGPRA
ncbi:DUF418 domain-containing protein [Actinomyces culturomici]|uniref:DUF418 domain-containing protein n=1 Tax=Actinomyces culturomici TaxID=1926276 RepID=UPI000E1FFF40|nr:DUF418 domain-containing protein [Actinomyces culturomici]